MRIESALDDIFVRAFLVEADDFGTAPETQPQTPSSSVSWPGMSPATPEHRKKYNIPPGLTNVHVSDDPSSHMVARGTDAKGRVKSFYTPEFHEQQAQQKFNRVTALHNKIPQLDQKLSEESHTNPHAGAVALSRHMGLRPGSTKDTKAAAQAYGASTLLAKHAKVENGKAHFDFIGKEGKHLQLSSDHPTVVNAVQQHLQGKNPEDQLFKGASASGMNDYLKKSTGALNEQGDQPLVKDLRTYHANALALNAINRNPEPPQSKSEFQKRRRDVANEVSSHLGNTPVMALNSYINPTVFHPWMTDPSWGEAGKKSRFAMGNDMENEKVHKFVEELTGLKPELEKELMDKWLNSVLWTHNEGDTNVVDPEGDDDSQ